jgi:hypothetical protein
MSTVFKIDNIKNFLEQEDVEVAFLIDTNVVMDYPEFNKWRTSLSGKVLFILTDQIPVELEHIRSRRSSTDVKAQASAEKAARAVNGLGQLFRKGNIQEGINIGDIGWFISVYVPKESDLTAELRELDSIANAFGPSDATEILLTKQLHETFPDLPSYFLSGDINLCNIMSVRGLPVKLSRGFPIELSSDEITRAHAKRKLNWDKELESIQKQMAKDVVEVELLLRAKRMIPGDYLKADVRWSDSQITVAEGSGSVDGLAFEWSLPFSAWDYPFSRIEDTEESTPSPSFWIGKASLDFGYGELKLDQKTVEQIADKIAECTLPFAGSLALPCLQDTISIMKYFFYVQYMNNKLYENSEQDFKADYIEAGGFAHFGVGRVFYALACGEGTDGEDRSWDTLVDLFSILRQSWEVGERKKIVINTKIEHS